LLSSILFSLFSAAPTAKNFAAAQGGPRIRATREKFVSFLSGPFNQIRESIMVSLNSGKKRSENPVYSCQTISEPGVYALGGDVFYDALIGTCTLISSDELTLKGNGKTLSGPGGSGSIAIKALRVKNVSIKNVEISGFGYGVQFNGVSNGLIEGNSVKDSGRKGIYLMDYPRNNAIRNNYVENARNCYGVLWSYYNVFEDNEAKGCRESGVFIYYNSIDNVFERTAITHSYKAIWLSQDSDNNSFNGAGLTRNGDFGAIEDDCDDNAFSGITIERCPVIGGGD
jgi:parallel beta-helix repeat protein